MVLWSKYKLFLSIGLLSASIIAFQLALMQILSLVQWYHFAYMVISVALLGFGTAGTVISIWKTKLLKHFRHLLPALMIMCGLWMPVVTEIIQQPSVRFDSYLIFVDYKYLWRLILTYFLLFTPFFLGALAIGLIFVKFVNEIGKIYFANLIGSGVGGIAGLFLLDQFFPSQLPAFVGILSFVAGIILVPKDRIVVHLLVAITGISVIGWKIIDPPHLVLSQYKDLSKTLLLPNAKLVLEKPGIYGFAQTVTSPALRYAPGLSLTSQVTAKTKLAAFVNGDWFGAITGTPNRDSAFILDYTSFALPYVISSRKSVLLLRAGSCIDVIHAHCKGAEKIVVVEPNSTMLSEIVKHYDEEGDSIFHRGGVEIHYVEPRTFLMMDELKYDLISLPVAGSFGGSAGLHALQEQYILTKEAFREMWFKLTSRGAISISSWMDYPSRYPLRILATMVEVLEDLGVQNPKAHIAAIRSWATISFVMTKSPIQENDVQQIRYFCEQMLFDPALLPSLDKSERERYNQLGDSSFFYGVEQILSTSRNQLYRTYDFNIRPATDNRPYFSQFLKWASLNRLSKAFGNRAVPFFELGYLILLITLIQVIVISFLLIILPLFRNAVRLESLFPVFLYFGGIGLGYMFIEMVLIQSFTLYLGNPAYAASAVISILLIASGSGSYFSNSFKASKRLLVVLAAIVVALMFYSFALTPILQSSIHFKWPLKIAMMLLLVSPMAFFLGIPFPVGLSRISNSNGVVPWAWGLNGCVSVISTALATIISIEMGHNLVMVFASLAYLVPLIAVLVRSKKETMF